MRVLGIDPGLLHTGWAVIDVDGPAYHYVASGVILPKSNLPLPERLRLFFAGWTICVKNFRRVRAVLKLHL